MTLNPDAMHISGVAHVYFADVGTPAPVTHGAAPANPWGEVGHTSYDNGIVITPTRTTEVKKTHQAPSGVREHITDYFVTVAATLEQVDATTLELYFQAENVGGNYWVPKAPTTIEKALYVRSIDGDKVLPIYVPRVTVGASGDVTLAPGSFTALPVTMRTLEHADADGLMGFLLAST